MLLSSFITLHLCGSCSDCVFIHCVSINILIVCNYFFSSLSLVCILLVCTLPASIPRNRSELSNPCRHLIPQPFLRRKKKNRLWLAIVCLNFYPVPQAAVTKTFAYKCFLTNTPTHTPALYPWASSLLGKMKHTPSELILQEPQDWSKQIITFLCVCEWGLFCSLHHHHYGLLFSKLPLSWRVDETGLRLYTTKLTVLLKFSRFLNKCSQVSWISAPLFNFHNCIKAILTFLPYFTAFIGAGILEFLLCHTDVTLPVAWCAWESCVSLHKSEFLPFYWWVVFHCKDTS